MGTDESTGGSLVSRRGFIAGAIGVGALAAVGVGAYGMKAVSDSQADTIKYLEVPKDAMTPLTDFEVVDNYETLVKPVKSIDVPYGTLAWVNDPSVAACLLPTKTGSPLSTVALLFLGSGDLVSVLEKSAGASDGFEIFDARATASGLIWTESNIMQNRWRIYVAPLTAGVLGAAMLVDEGDSTYETPTLAAVGDRGIWQKIPMDKMDLENPSVVTCVEFSGANPKVLFENRRRNGTPLWCDEESVVITPREDSSTTYHTLTRLAVPSGEILDTLTLPASMKPLEAAYGATGFMFSFPDIYSYGEGIANLGTYVPFDKPADGNYSAVGWFDFARTPSAPPAWAKDLLVVKSTYSVCVVDLANRTYGAIDVENGAEGYGDYLVSCGSADNFVTYTNIDHAPVGEKAIHTGRLRIWAPAENRQTPVPSEDELATEAPDQEAVVS